MYIVHKEKTVFRTVETLQEAVRWVGGKEAGTVYTITNLITDKSLDIEGGFFRSDYIKEQLLNIQEVADLLNISYSTAYLMTRSGEIPSIKIGASRFVLKNELSQISNL